MKAPCSLLLLFLFVSCMQAQNKAVIRQDKKYNSGIYDESKKKWLTPPVYISIDPVTIIAGLNKVRNVAYIAINDKGSVVIDSNGSKVISPLFSSITCIDKYKRLFVVRNSVNSRSLCSLFQPETGIWKNAANFDHYQIIPHTSLVELKKDNRYACLYTPDLKLSAFEYETPLVLEGNEWMTKKAGKYGMLNSENTIAIPFEYDSLKWENSYTCEKYFAAKDGKWGMLNTDGTVYLPFQYEGIESGFVAFRSRMLQSCWDLLPVKMNGKWGVIDRQGKVVLEPAYDSIRYVTDKDEFCFYKDGKTGLVSHNGKILFPFKFTHFQRMDLHLAVKSKDKKMLVNNGCKLCDEDEGEDGKWGIADSSGNVLMEVNASILPVFDSRYEYYGSVDPAADSAEVLRSKIRQDSMYIGYLWNIGGTKSKTIIRTDSMQMESADLHGDFIQVPMLIHQYSCNLTGGRTGLVDMKGRVVLPVENEDIGLVMNDMERELFNKQVPSLTFVHRIMKEQYSLSQAPFRARRYGKWGLFDWKNQPVIPARYDSISDAYIVNPVAADASDSVLQATNYFKEVIEAYENGNRYYYSPKGKFLFKLLPHERGSAFIHIPKLSEPAGNADAVPAHYLLVHINAVDAYYSSTSTVEQVIYTPEGEEEVVNTTIKDTRYIPLGGKMNLLNTLTYDYLFPEAVEDLRIFVSEHKWASQPEQVKWHFYPKGYSETPPYKEERAYPELKNGNFPNAGEPLPGSRIFYKLDGKWYTYDGSGKVTPDKKQAFDSLFMLSPTHYRAWKKGKTSVYNVNHKGTFEPAAEYELPENEAFEFPKVVCNDCRHQYKTVIRPMDRVLYNEYGETSGTVLVYDTLLVPFVSKGKFNIMTSQDTFAFDKWYDDILLPMDDPAGTVSVTDSSSVIYKPFRNYSVSFVEWAYAAKLSVALKEGNTWKLTTLKEPSRSISGIEKISLGTGVWIVHKDHRILEYKTDDVYAAPRSVGQY